MPSESSLNLLRRAQPMVTGLYRLVVTDAWYHKGGNIEVASEESQSHSMASVLAGIRGIGPRNQGVSVRALGGRHIAQDRESWINQGKRTLENGKGICTDLAAAAGVKFLDIVESSNYEAQVEIISSTTHAFVVVNREGEVRQPMNWGEDAFVIDAWYQNQFPRNHVAGVFWASDRGHPVVEFIRQNAYRLRIDCTLRAVIGALF